MVYRMVTTFPDSQVPQLGMFFNGRTSRVDVAIHNKESNPITIHLIGGHFSTLDTMKPLHNVA